MGRDTITSYLCERRPSALGDGRGSGGGRDSCDGGDVFGGGVAGVDGGDGRDLRGRVAPVVGVGVRGGQPEPPPHDLLQEARGGAGLPLSIIFYVYNVCFGVQLMGTLLCPTGVGGQIRPWIRD